MITRFAPSPTGPLHLGHAYSALLAYDMAQAAGGTFLLRIEDIDQTRARPGWEMQIYDDLHWLGIDWPEPVMRQSDRLPTYAAALDQLWNAGLLYPCTCKRRDIAAAASAPQEGAPIGTDGIIYPGTCRHRNRSGPRPTGAVLRLDMTRAARQVTYHDTSTQIVLPDTFINAIGDVVLARRDMGTSYHLSVVIDDAAQGITDVVRGADLAAATPIHALLQQLLDLPTPRYHHHKLIRDDTGKRLAKRDDARAIATYRTAGHSPQSIRQMVGLPSSSW
ncbi:tRNA glutamyl-Q(34) synthetase GluQRS [Yoonia sp.]|uniref:tRNA glutamyl-Q(34) synthetase GluQRS n=1 Tax=Yoonia sp. TaxID=2212373 RepID=UPI0019FEF8EC|nr:tRNA glutamyl-Q(34) synthetase GluQRS [Yoonia sp.]MBE0413845.1 tRNA glutamyl-Q(34) synthetase GluQRS [Yoonia sp.]